MVANIAPKIKNSLIIHAQYFKLEGYAKRLGASLNRQDSKQLNLVDFEIGL
jgi:hypothetical protein